MISFLSLSISLYTVHITESTYCLWDGTWLNAKDEDGYTIEHKSCQYGDCNEIMCDMLWNTPGAASVSVSMLEPSSKQLHYTYIDTTWIVLFSSIIIGIIMNIISLCLIKKRKSYDID
jgi:hypothetical protein